MTTGVGGFPRVSPCSNQFQLTVTNAVSVAPRDGNQRHPDGRFLLAKGSDVSDLRGPVSRFHRWNLSRSGKRAPPRQLRSASCASPPTCFPIRSPSSSDDRRSAQCSSYYMNMLLTTSY